MKSVSRSLIAAVSLSLLLSSPLQAASKKSWDGTWVGAWGGSDPTAITIAGNQVVSYQYGGATTPVKRSRVTAKKIVYGDNGVTVTLIRISANAAHAMIHSGQGDGAAELKRH